MKIHSYRVFWSDEDGKYIVQSSEYPGISAFGDTEEQAIAEFKIVCEMMADL